MFRSLHVSVWKGPPECYMVAKCTPLGKCWPLREPNAHGEHALVSSYRLAKALSECPHGLERDVSRNICMPHGSERHATGRALPLGV